MDCSTFKNFVKKSLLAEAPITKDSKKDVFASKRQDFLSLDPSHQNEIIEQLIDLLRISAKDDCLSSIDVTNLINLQHM